MYLRGHCCSGAILSKLIPRPVYKAANQNDRDMRAFERRIQQRFSLQLPIVIEDTTGARYQSLTRDVSARGVFFYTDAPGLELSARIAFSMILPTKIIGTKEIRVRCQGTVVRLEGDTPKGTAVAATIESYDF